MALPYSLKILYAIITSFYHVLKSAHTSWNESLRWSFVFLQHAFLLKIFGFCMCLKYIYLLGISSVQFSSVGQSCPTVCGPISQSMPGLPVHHQFQEFTQTHVHWHSSPQSSPEPHHPTHKFLFHYLWLSQLALWIYVYRRAYEQEVSGLSYNWECLYKWTSAPCRICSKLCVSWNPVHSIPSVYWRFLFCSGEICDQLGFVLSLIKVSLFFNTGRMFYSAAGLGYWLSDRRRVTG